MAPLKTDSFISRRIVRSFLDFLNSVEPATGVDLESIEVAKQCLLEAFKLNTSIDDDQSKPDSLIGIFTALEFSRLQENKSDTGHASASSTAPTSSAPQGNAEANLSKGEDLPSNQGDATDELFGQFFSALERIHYLKTMPDGSDDPVQLEMATKLFHDAITEMERSGCEEFSSKNLAETFKLQGNKALQSKLYPKAIEFYDCAIALCVNNAVYYCNRAAAHTQIYKYTEAIRDCYKSIDIDPNYSKAYSRLGSAYHAQGKYRDAIEKGFLKALQLDPTNEAVKVNFRLAEQKLKEEQLRAESDQIPSSFSSSSSSGSSGGSGSHDAPPQFGSTANAAEFAHMVMTMTSSYHGRHFQESQEDDSRTDGFEEPGVGNGGEYGNLNFNFGGQMPEGLSGAVRSAMGMFSGAASGANSQGTPDERARLPN